MGFFCTFAEQSLKNWTWVLLKLLNLGFHFWSWATWIRCPFGVCGCVWVCVCVCVITAYIAWLQAVRILQQKQFMPCVVCFVPWMVLWMLWCYGCYGVCVRWARWARWWLGIEVNPVRWQVDGWRITLFFFLPAGEEGKGTFLSTLGKPTESSISVPFFSFLVFFLSYAFFYSFCILAMGWLLLLFVSLR